MKKLIIEKQLEIKGDYQFRALYSKNFLRSNWHNNKLIALNYMIKPSKGMTILDLGAGSGNFELAFANKVKKILAVDYHDDAVKFLKSQLSKRDIKNVEVKLFDITNLSKLKSQKFDVILLSDVIEHLGSKDVNRLVKDLKKFIKNMGKIYIVTPNYKSSWVLIEKGMDLFHISPHLGGDQHLFYFDRKKLTDVFVRNGYKINSIATFNLLSFIMPKFLSKVICLLEIKYLGFGNLLISSISLE